MRENLFFFYLIEGLRIFVKDLNTHVLTSLLAKIILLSNDNQLLKKGVEGEEVSCYVTANHLLLSHS